MQAREPAATSRHEQQTWQQLQALSQNLATLQQSVAGIAQQHPVIVLPAEPTTVNSSEWAGSYHKI